MKRLLFGLLALALSASPSRAAGVKLVIQGGKVTLDAQDATVHQILTEWSRVGKTRIVNLEGVNTGPLTITLEDVPEKMALDTILRSVPGYLAAPRAVYTADASLYDRILIMPTTTTVAARTQTPATSTPAPFPPYSPNVTQLRAAPVLTPGVLPEPDVLQSDDAAIAAAAAAGLITAPTPSPSAQTVPSGTLRAPSFDQTGTQPPAQAPMPTNPWNVPVGTSQPSVAPPTPPQATAQPPSRPRPPQADR